MPKEIEFKFLVDHKKWTSVVAEKKISMQQGYISTNPEKTVRVRVTDNEAFITIKGKSVGAVRAEYEYEIPLAEGQELLGSFCDNLIVKTRHLVRFAGNIWEVDVFEDSNKGLITAEIELNTEDEQFETPDWVTKNVTEDYKYSNSNLAIKPFSQW